MFCPKELYGITGWPLGHSLSPRLHNWGFGLKDLPGVFMAWPVPAGGMAAFVQAVRTLNVRGCCVTIPHKEAVLPLLDRVSARALAVGAVNTLYWEGERLCGDNTDVQGFAEPLRHRAAKGQSWRRALVLGAGGAARAVLAALAELRTAGCVGEILLTNRHAERTQELAAHFAVLPLAWEEREAAGADLLINTTPLGMSGEQVQHSPVSARAFGAWARGLAYDLVYNPLQTTFLREARAAGWDTQDGLDMFVGQGLAQFALWTGTTLPAQGARAVLEEALQA